MASLSEIYQKYFGQIKNTKSLFVILMIGILLLMVSGIFTTPKNEAKTAQKGPAVQATSAKALEEKLAKTLSLVKGAGNVSVMITYEDGGQSVFAKDENMQEKTTEDAGKGSRDRTAENKLVLKNDAGGGQSPVLIKTTEPKISGVLVVAQGGEDATVKSNLVEAVKAVLDVKPHRIQVLSR